jgi:hypothetical protein
LCVNQDFDCSHKYAPLNYRIWPCIERWWYWCQFRQTDRRMQDIHALIHGPAVLFSRYRLLFLM